MMFLWVDFLGCYVRDSGAGGRGWGLYPPVFSEKIDLLIKESLQPPPLQVTSKLGKMFYHHCMWMILSIKSLLSIASKGLTKRFDLTEFCWP